MALASIDGIKLFVSALFASVASNILKFILDYAKNKKPNLKLLYKEYGGMPSGHSAFLGAMITSLYIIEGLSTLFFAITAISVLFIVDLMAVRWFHGTQGRL
ncbi:divergent PAP2 family protein, partial [Candidatus Woesearchaeota archaeon]|nr:divergent PAP2 family protein [Candidatus Woesearchaeota archaeon]